MQIPTGTLSVILTDINTVLEACKQTESLTAMAQALEQLADAITRVEADTQSSDDADLMEAAFAILISQLPEDATRFFSEGMEQMDALDYPPHVRQVMEKYHREWPVNRSLH